MSIRRLSALALAAVALLPLAADAQVLNRPQRAMRGLFGARPTDPTRSRQELSLSIDALGGSDDNAAAGEGIGVPATPNGRGTTGSFDTRLLYFRGRTERSFTLGASGSFVTYRNVPLDPSRSFTVDGSAHTNLGTRATWQATQAVSYYSQFRIASPFTAGLPLEDLPTGDSAIFGLGERASINSTTATSLDYLLTRSHHLTPRYSFTTRHFTEGDDGGYRAHMAGVRYGRQLSRWLIANADVEFGRTRFAFRDGGDTGRPLNEDRVGGGLSWDRRLSPRRSVAFSVDAGGLRVESVTGLTSTPFTVWTPYATVATRIDVNRNWNVSGQFRRGADTLEGLTTEAFLNDSGTVTLSGLVTNRLDLSFIGGLARGSTASEGAVDSHYETATGSAQARIAITRMLSAIVGYHYYHYDFTNTVLPPGVSPRFGRNAVRVGLSLWLPLYGTYDRR